jgi:hypothetical protein
MFLSVSGRKSHDVEEPFIVLDRLHADGSPLPVIGKDQKKAPEADTNAERQFQTAELRAPICLRT